MSTAATPAGTSFRDQARRLAAPRSRHETALAAGIYTAGAVAITWPLVTDLGSTIYLSPGRFFGDYSSIIAHLREMVEELQFPFAEGRIEDFNAPYGFPVAWVANLASFSSWIVLYLLALLFGATAAVGLFVLLGFVLSGVAMFLLARRITGSAWIGLIVGWAFAFYPFVVANGEHPHHIHGWPMVLIAWRMLALAERPTVRDGVLAGLASLVAFAWTPYYILLGGVLVLTLSAATLIWSALRRNIRRQILPQTVALAIPLAFMLIMRLLVSLEESAAAIAPTVTLTDVFAQTARPINYLVPSGHSPVLGGWSSDVLAARGMLDNTEKQLYVGWSLVALALCGGLAALFRRLPSSRAAVALSFSAVTLVALAFSAPPKVSAFGTLIPFPSLWVFELNSSWRIYSRFVVVVMLGLCVVAALGLAYLTHGRNRKVAAAVLIAASVIVPLDVWARHDNPTRALMTDPVYATLRELPPGIVAEYPIQPSAFAEHYEEIYNQQYHDKPILNGFPHRSVDEERALSVASLEDPATPGRLTSRGVRYVLVRHAPTIEQIPPPGNPGPDFELIEGNEFATLYRVRASR